MIPQMEPAGASGGSRSMAGAMFQRHLEKMRNEKQKDFPNSAGNPDKSPLKLHLGTPSSQTLLPFC